MDARLLGAFRTGAEGHRRRRSLVTLHPAHPAPGQRSASHFPHSLHPAGPLVVSKRNSRRKWV